MSLVRLLAAACGLAVGFGGSPAATRDTGRPPPYGSAALTCAPGSQACQASQPLFACNLANASRIAAEGTLVGLVLISTKDCTVVTAGTPLDVQSTTDAAVVYATSRGVHVGYLPRNVTVPPNPFPELPRALHGIWLPSARHCRVYEREGADEGNEAASVLDLSARGIDGFEGSRRPLLLTPIEPQSWTIEFYQTSDSGHVGFETVTMSLDAGVLSVSNDRTRRIRCPGLLPTAQRAAADEQRAAAEEQRRSRAQRRARPGNDFPISCKGWSGTIVERTGLNTTQAAMIGIVTASDMQEYCERDPGGETKASGGRLTLSQCVQHNLAQERRPRLLSRANCRTGQITFTYGDRGPWRATFPLEPDADTSCISGMPAIIAQFRTLCPANAPRMLPRE